MTTISGWLFDAYPIKDRMVFWIKDENGGSIHRLEDTWTPSIYVGSDSRTELKVLAENRAVQHYIKRYDFVSRYERIRDYYEQSTVLQLTLAESSKAASLANTIEDIDAYDRFRLYNIDILPAQTYFYEHDLFPLAKCKVDVCKDGKLEWVLDDNVRFTNYRLPEFKVVNIDVTTKQKGRLPSFTDKIDRIVIKSENGDNETIEIREESEEDALYELMRVTATLDPDFIFTQNGDEWMFPYLATRAEEKNNQIQQLILGRERIPILSRPKQGGGITYFSYGRVHYRASSVMLLGRIHIDTNNSLIHDPSVLPGLYEIARVCRMPLHTISRSTIGRALTSMQFYLAYKRKLLVPWKPASLEKVKTIKELVVADRGGLIMEPQVGVHENVAEFDFVSLYPSIITKLNVGADTINCECCPGSKNIVPELGYRVCEKRKGLVAESLEVPLQNRKDYKYFRKLATNDKSWAIFDSRQGILRTIGHVSFGYQGHAHSHFGLIDGHIAICAWARFIANKARKTAEELDYDVLHLIIDSLFVKKKKKKPDAIYCQQQQQYMELKEEIEKATGFEISYEGEYKWIAFLSSKSNPKVGVPNRYFGCYQDGTIKDRGIETRRRDTPAYFSRFQREVLEIMAQGNNINEVKSLMPKVKETFQKYKQQLQEGRVPLVDLIFTKMLSKDTNAYTVNTAETGAIYQLQDEGKFMRAGQILQYVITDYYRRNSRKRAIPVSLINEKTTYDSRRYTQLLAAVCNSVTEPFGYSIEL